MFRLRHGLQELNHVLQMVLSARAPQFYSSQFKAEYTHPNFQRPHFQFDAVWLIDHVKL